MPSNSKGKKPVHPAADAVLPLLEAYAQVLGPKTAVADQHPIWGNGDVLVDQWKRELGSEGTDAVLMGIRIRRVGMVIDKLIIEQCTQHGIKHHEFILLMALRRIGKPYALRPSDILKMHSVTSGTATYRLDQLVKRELVTRVPDPKDRRGYLIGLTTQGKQIVDTILETLRQSFDALLAPFGAVPGGFAALEAGLQLFESCLLPKPA
ncbi:MAG: hypothetical protein DI587_02710 [Variovorax paradoxus]|nr:MAG: hypothetical protein DI583_02710 [Variovorax paradoxus]PZQ15617.1 MAG: hypothetical protein DI587_02710 [Variovorax paradoxus]